MMNKPMTTAEAKEFYMPLLSLFEQLKTIEVKEAELQRLLLARKEEKNV